MMISPRLWSGVGLMLVIVSPVPVAAATAVDRTEAMEPRVRELTLAALARADGLWDDRAALLWTGGGGGTASRKHGVRPTSWYALGLLVRDAPGDRERALRAFDAVLNQQIHGPGQVWDGTFFRQAEEQRPMPGAKRWDDYDPNWRQFIGCVFAQAMLHFPDRLPAELSERMERAIAHALVGEEGEGRLIPAYTNIALMHGFLLGFAGERLDRPEWIAAAEQWVEEIAADFAAHESFEEYNSPTYYGVDLYGLALLRAQGATPTLRAAGATMEAALWRDIGRFYHAGLRNLTGPYDRSYGMVMEDYVALTGTWIGFVRPAAETPLPDLAGPMRHGNDFLFTPCFALVGAAVPTDVMPHLERFQGERHLVRPIADGQRVATAWLGDDLMIGGQATALSRGVPHARSQFHPATVHWRRPDGAVGWIALRTSSRVNARAEPGRLVVESVGDAVYRVQAPGLTAADFAGEHWQLPGLTVRVQTDAHARSVTLDADGADLTFREATRFELLCSTQP